MEIKLLDKKEYKNFTLEFKYKTNFYYDIVLDPNEIFSLKLVKKQFENEIDKNFTSKLYEDYFENAEAFSLNIGRNTTGYIEIDKEGWNNRLRITNILVLDEFKRKGYGTLLIKKAKEIAAMGNFREIILETQSCNYKAIEFYIKNGFIINGIDLSCYSNDDIKKKEVRLELVYKIIR